MLADRLLLLKRLEQLRRRPCIVYVTSSRANCSGQMSADAVPELLLQLNALPPGTEELDLLIVSNGGDPTVAWRIVSLIRERVKKFGVLIPQAAYSAATLLALGADEILMHPNGNLGPTDPQITSPRRGTKEGTTDTINFGSEDLSALLRFAREDVRLTDQEQLLSVFNHFCEEVGSVAVGVAARSAQLTVSMGEKLLQLHMDGESASTKAKTIAQALTRDYFHHGYPVSRKEARSIGLPVADVAPEIENLMWRIWLDLSDELKLREPLNHMALVRADPNCAPLFEPAQQVNIPANLPPALQQQAYQAILGQVAVVQVPAVEFQGINALLESVRFASRFETKGLIFVTRLPDMQFKMSVVIDHMAWRTVHEEKAVPKPEVRSRARKRLPAKVGPVKVAKKSRNAK